MTYPTRHSFDRLLIATGRIEGFSIVNKMGKNPDIDSGSVPEDVWDGGGVYTGFPLGDPEPVVIVSSSANDSASGTGARTVTISGLNDNWDLTSEAITLNGTSASSETTNLFRRVHTAFVSTAGSLAYNEGTLTIRHQTTVANVFAIMHAQTNQTNVSAYTIPRGKTGYMAYLHGFLRGGGTTAVDGVVYVRLSQGVFRQRRPFSIGPNYTLNEDILGGIVIPEKADLIIRITNTTGSNIDIAAGYDLVLVDN